MYPTRFKQGGPSTVQTSSSIRATLVAAVTCTLLLTPSVNWAWGPDGHQAAGAIADQLLAGSPAAQQVHSLIGDMGLRNAAVWADCAKGVSSSDDTRFKYTVAKNSNGSARFPECTQFESATGKAQMEAFVSRNWKQCGSVHGSETCHKQYHYTDVSDLRDHYAENLAGTNKHDVVHAISAAIAVLRGQPSPAPFQISDKREALLILSHYIGDIHQPLHVEAAYLDAQGHNVDPDSQGLNPKNDTVGGNLLFDGSKRFHAEWDDIPGFLAVDGSGFADGVTKARAVVATSGDMATWSAQWATDTIVVGKAAFDQLRFTAKPGQGSNGNSAGWTVSGIDARYRAHADVIKGDQLAKAGARLAQVLKAVWPDDGTAPTGTGTTGGTTGGGSASCPAPSNVRGYLTTSELPDVRTWLPPAPTTSAAGAPSSVAAAVAAAAQAADDAVIQQTRALLNGPRGQQAAQDDVFAPEDIALRFKVALGLTLTRGNAPRLMALIEKIEVDGGQLLSPIKRSVAQGGRPRPFVADVALPNCLIPVDMAGKRHNDMVCFHLAESGSYPSTHALVGMFIGMLFTDLAPDRAAPMMNWGLGFGDSRVVCGFHYPSDVSNGRLAAAALWSRLLADSTFKRDLEAARREVERARAH